MPAWMLDNAVLTFGTVIENALQERIEIGEGAQRRRIARYRFEELMRPDFKLPLPEEEGFGEQPSLGAGDPQLDALLAAARAAGVYQDALSMASDAQPGNE